jgi:hypothetical protein
MRHALAGKTAMRPATMDAQPKAALDHEGRCAGPLTRPLVKLKPASVKPA